MSAGDVLRFGSTVAVVSEIAAHPAVEEAAHGLIGDSPGWRAACDSVARAARTALPVLVTGDSGTGKELMAALVHRASGRGGRLVAVNCTAIPADLVESTLFGHVRGAFTGASVSATGYFRDADGGTLFLDEIGDLPLAVQPRLLRVLEDGAVVPVGSARPHRVDVRIVCATHVDLDAAVAAGAFRGDLYARLCGWPVRLPALAERREDILRLARHFGLRESTASAAEALVLYRWPFNVRELLQLVRRTRAAHPEGPIDLEQLPATLQQTLTSARAGQPPEPASRGGRPARPSAQRLTELLAAHDQNVSAVARELGCDRKQVYRWLGRYGLGRDRSHLDPSEQDTP